MCINGKLRIFLIFYSDHGENGRVRSKYHPQLSLAFGDYTESLSANRDTGSKSVDDRSKKHWSGLSFQSWGKPRCPPRFLVFRGHVSLATRRTGS